jgi:pyruvate carboxylase subunit B
VQVRIGDATFDIVESEDGSLTLNGRSVEVMSAPAGPHTTHLLVDGQSHVVTLERLDGGRFTATIGGHVVEGSVKSPRDLLLERYGMTNGAETTDRTVRAPMPGLVVRVLVEAGVVVEAGQGVIVLEAMKMENVLKSPSAGVVSTVHVAGGTAVGKNELLLEIDALPAQQPSSD